MSTVVSSLRRAAAVAAMTIGFVVVAAPAASAHVLHDGPQPSNYRSVLTDFPSPTTDVRLQLLDNGLHLQLVVRGSHTVIVDGYDGQPYLRVSTAGAAVNVRAPDYYLNRTTALATIPSGATVGGPPRWTSIGRNPTVVWHDHRTHYMGYQPPPSVAAEPGVRHVIDRWIVPVTIDGRTVLARGELLWVPGPSPLPYLLGALAGAVLLGSACVRRRWWPIVLATTAVGLAGVEIARSIALYTGRTGSVGARLAAVPAYGAILVGLAVVAVIVTRRAVRRRESAAGFAMFLAATALLTMDLPGLSVLWRSQMLTGTSAATYRLLTSVALGLSLALLVSGGLLLHRLSPLAAAAAIAPNPNRTKELV